jgi:AcrR family transcriptional regulator
MAIPVTDRPLRRDAERNLERVLVAAREAFAEHGMEASVEEVARRAGVGIGTVYRRFPTKADLVDAVFEASLADLSTIAREALELADPWDGFCTFLERTLELNAANRGLHAVLATNEHGRERIAAVRRKMRPLVGRVIARAQEQGTLRPDFRPQDLSLIFMSAGRVVEMTADVAPEMWRRLLGLLLDGLRSEAATPLPHPALSFQQLDRLKRAR